MSFVVCSKGHQVSFGAKFCHQCGEPLPKIKSKVAEATFAETGFENLLPGTRLRDRYVILGLLGQGGFGKTYLAEDTGRFNEKVAIKQFISTVKEKTALEKGEELFQREAAILHQLQHPQIPCFWETFREEEHLFLVEDFIEGQTYHSLLEERLQQGKCFKEAEILKLFCQLLPVLSYLHSQGVIHRDISPDNIMLRTKDQQAVLIDLGGVKQVAIDITTQVAGLRNRANSKATCLGKVGYAPDEQMRLGIVAPDSDLYALAVTALVLMTGKEPQDLLDQRTLHWNWHKDITLSPRLTKILNQMLHSQPAQRFKSANEILQLIQSGSSSRTYAATKPTEVLPSNGSSQTHGVSQVTKLKPINTTNNSGQGNIFDSSIQVPDEIKGWNWGAFLFPGFWLFPNRVWIGSLVWIPYVGWIMSFVLGAKGNEWAWKSRSWNNIAAFKAHQRAWTVWGLVVSGSVFSLCFIISFLAAFTAELEKKHVSSSSSLSTSRQETERSDTFSPSSTSPSFPEESTHTYPAVAINLFRSSCKQSFQAKAPTVSVQIVDMYCTCAANEIQQRMSYQDYVELDMVISKSQQNQQLNFSEQQKLEEFNTVLNENGVLCRQRLGL